MPQQITELLAEIARHGQTLEPDLNSGKIGSEDARDALLDATRKLQILVTGPRRWLMGSIMNSHDGLSTLRAVSHFKIAQAIPVEGSIPIADLAAVIKLPEQPLMRILRQLIPQMLFTEPKKGHFGHSIVSVEIARDPLLQAWVSHNVDELYVSGTKFVEMMEKWGDSGEPTETAFNLAYDTNDTFWEYLAKHPEVGARFGATMKAQAADSIADSPSLEGIIPWNDLGKATVVDLGGSIGHLGIALATHYASLDVIIQDLPELTAEANANIPEELKSRVQFMPHSFFDPQPVHGARIYVMRQVLHDWSDKYSLKILRNLISVMDPRSSRILILDSVLPEPNTISGTQEQWNRSMDHQMYMILRAHERSRDMWEALVAEADERLKIVGIRKLPNSNLSVVEVAFATS
ncbi:MAG: hypothetical protein M1818_003479 [Claussenomyces sp. TS43310]|nr:MAG: hypothetical protein M1818_003479 [Claussenomyces sp. TS43310]